MAAAIMRVYQTQFDAHPAATLAATNGGLSAVADVVAQTAQMLVSLRLVVSLVSYLYLGRNGMTQSSASPYLSIRLSARFSSPHLVPKYRAHRNSTLLNHSDTIYNVQSALLHLG